MTTEKTIEVVLRNDEIEYYNNTVLEIQGLDLTINNYKEDDGNWKCLGRVVMRIGAGGEQSEFTQEFKAYGDTPQDATNTVMLAYMEVLQDANTYAHLAGQLGEALGSEHPLHFSNVKED